MAQMKATKSFQTGLGSFTAGRSYDMDPKDPQVQGLITSGYLEEAQTEEGTDASAAGDNGGDGAVSDSGVSDDAEVTTRGTRKSGSRTSGSRSGADGDAAGAADNSADSGGGKASGSKR